MLYLRIFYLRVIYAVSCFVFSEFTEITLKPINTVVIACIIYLSGDSKCMSEVIDHMHSMLDQFIKSIVFKIL